MKAFDLTQEITTGMPVFPGTGKAILHQAATLGQKGFNEIRMNLTTHTGTHIDCPKHLINDGLSTGSFPVDKFIGKAFVMDCTGLSKSGKITVRMLTMFEHLLQQVSFVLFRTDHSLHWGDAAYFQDFPVLEKDAAAYLLKFKLKGAGIDAPGFDAADSKDLPVHHLLLAKEIILIENLTNLALLPSGNWWFSCFPLKIKEGDGSPVRAVAWTEI